MDIIVPTTGGNPKVLLQRVGYHEFVDPNTGEVSYIRRLGNEFYPRFHIYVDEDVRGFVLSLHIDQKHASYAGTRAHAGEYTGAVVEAEAARLQEQMVTPAKATLQPAQPSEKKDTGRVKVSLRSKLKL